MHIDGDTVNSPEKPMSNKIIRLRDLESTDVHIFTAKHTLSDALANLVSSENPFLLILGENTVHILRRDDMLSHINTTTLRLDNKPLGSVACRHALVMDASLSLPDAMNTLRRCTVGYVVLAPASGTFEATARVVRREAIIHSAGPEHTIPVRSLLSRGKTPHELQPDCTALHAMEVMGTSNLREVMVRTPQGPGLFSMKEVTQLFENGCNIWTTRIDDVCSLLPVLDDGNASLAQSLALMHSMNAANILLEEREYAIMLPLELFQQAIEEHRTTSLLSLLDTLVTMQDRELRRKGLLANQLDHALSTALGVGIIGISSAGRIHYCNTPARSLLNLGDAPLHGTDVYTMLPDADATAQLRDAIANAVPGVEHSITLPPRRECGELHIAIVGVWEADKLTGHVLTLRNLTEETRREAELRRLAYYDDLTGLPNRVLFVERLRLELSHARRERKSLGVLLMDLDRFKAVNDTLGHQAGDSLLQQVAQRLRGLLRDTDTVSRLAGDEFTFILPGIHSIEQIRFIVRKIAQCLRAPFTVAGQQVRIGASIGAAIYPLDGTTPDALIAAADSDMYRVKERRNSLTQSLQVSPGSSVHGASPRRR